MKVAILGYASQGVSAYQYWSGLGDEVTICDTREDLELPAGAHAKLGPQYLEKLNEFDLIVRAAPSIHPRDIVAANGQEILAKVTSNTNEFFRVCPTKNTIGVTGTKGKGTTSTLIAKMLEAAGLRVHLGGNIGIPPLELLKDNIGRDDWVVMELANFQLIDFIGVPHIGVCVMVVPEHLNWHADMAEYITAKSQLFARQTELDVAIYFADNEYSKRIAGTGAGKKVPFFALPGAVVQDGMITIDGQVVCATSELKLLGKHNWQNACAAVTAVWQAGIHNIEAMKSVLTTFSGLPHRIEFLREINGVRWYNDSFATGLHATEAAILAVPGKKVMILGGFERMLPLDHFGEFAIKHAEEFRTMLLIGESAKRLAATLDVAGFSNYVIDESLKTMPAIVKRAATLAQTGDAIVLSPGFASFDMFKNFEERGEKYRAAVADL